MGRALQVESDNFDGQYHDLERPPMNPKQRTLAILEGKPVDRPAIDLWYTGEVLDSLVEYTGAESELEMWRALGIDKIAWVSPAYTGPLMEKLAEAEAVTQWGTQLKVVESGSSRYLEQMHYPLVGMEEPEELESFPWPDADNFDLEPLFDFTTSHGGEFATLGPWVSIFEVYCQMRGLEEAMIDLLTNEEFLTAALDKIEAIQASLLERIFSDPRPNPDLIFVSDDMGSQNNLLMSVASWEKHVGPRLKRWCDLVHRNGSRVFYHTDGAVRPLLGRLIDAGIDVLNPLQHRCPGMDLAELKAEFGDRVAFHGGVDTQNVLPFGSPSDVRAETRHCLDALEGTRFVCASCHNLQAGTPVENILAMIEEVRGRSLREG